MLSVGRQVVTGDGGYGPCWEELPSDVLQWKVVCCKGGVGSMGCALLYCQKEPRTTFCFAHLLCKCLGVHIKKTKL